MPNIVARLAALLCLGAALTACASSANRAETAAGDASAAGCALRPQDSTFALLGPVFRDCQVQTKAALLTKDIRPDFRPSTTNTKSGNCYSAELEYVVNEQGAVETKTVRVVKTTDQALADAIISILPQWKFEPAKLNGVAVRQIVSDTYSIQSQVVIVPAGTRPSSPTGTKRPARSTPRC